MVGKHSTSELHYQLHYHYQILSIETKSMWLWIQPIKNPVTVSWQNQEQKLLNVLVIPVPVSGFS